VRRLPDSSLMVRMTRGRAWIAVLGVLLTGIVAVNVVTLSLAASVGHIYQNIAALEQENSLLHSRDAVRSGSARVRHDAPALGLLMPTTDQIGYVQAGPRDVAVAAQRLAAAGSG
jgi:Tfp pilus assembly protein PilN